MSTPKDGNLNEFFRKRALNEQSFAGRALSRFEAFNRKSIKFDEDTFEDKKSSKVRKVRPPRFVSFRMELEPYNKEKAFALQNLNHGDWL